MTRRLRPRRLLVVAVAAVTLAASGCAGVVAASWVDAKREENDQFTCAMKVRERADGGVDVRDGPHGKVCVYFAADGRAVQTLPLDDG